MTISIPSKKIVIVDVPETENFQGSFVYNFFTPDERSNNLKQGLPEFIKNRSRENFEANFIESNNFNRFVPRYIKLSWAPKLYNTNIQNVNKILIKDNLDKIYNESSFTLDEFSSVSFQDENFEEKLDFFVKRMLDETRKRLPENELKQFESPLDIIKFLKTRVSKELNDEFLTDSFLKFKKKGYIFKDKKTNKEKFIETKVDKFNQIKSRVQINNKVLNKALKTITENSAFIYNEDVMDLLDKAEQLQQTSISNNPSNLISGQEYDLDIANYIDIKPVDVAGFKPQNEVIGYLIRKTELDGSNVVEHNPIVVESPSVGTIVDLEVRYGVTYQYTIETISLFTTQAVDTENNQVIVLSFLVSSKPTKAVTVECNEYIPPEHPSDFIIQWDYKQTCPRLSWNFPVNFQQDVKYFQIFRRKTIFEPFELIKMYDFDDSLVLSPFLETPDESLIEKLTSPKSFFLDSEFKKEQDDSYIYAVCCVDAHGYSSNYSSQYKVRFNRFENKLKKELVSKAGAPKAYPNFFLNQDMFVDTIKDSGHKEVKVYFTPEYLKVLNTNGTDLKLLSENNSIFKLQMINIDLQEQKVFDINITDLRNNKNK